jgi:hypothetical protein
MLRSCRSQKTPLQMASFNVVLLHVICSRREERNTTSSPRTLTEEIHQCLHLSGTKDHKQRPCFCNSASLLSITHINAANTEANCRCLFPVKYRVHSTQRGKNPSLYSEERIVENLRRNPPKSTWTFITTTR